jgi:LysR family transcriptional regulator, regulator for genes of the gallate degradation pathway
MDINFRHLHVAREVGRQGTISAAARNIALSQPAITQAIAALERIVGVSLFNRSNVGVTATPAGALFIERIDRAIAHLRDAVAETTRGSREAATPLRRIERSMTTAQLNALVAVVEHGSFSQAARAVGVSQPTVHRAARELEQLIGLALFERTSFGVQPTREAQRLARGAQLAFAEIEQARAELAAFGGGEAGRTVIGAMPLARSFLLPRALIEFTNEHPLHAVSILEGSYDNLIAELRRGTADFLIGALRDPLVFKDVVQEHLFDDELAIIVRAGHPLLEHKRVTVKTLARYSWIAPRRESPLHDHFDMLFRVAKVAAPQSTIECNSLVAARSLLLESDRVMLLSFHQIHYDLKAGLLAALPHPQGRVTRAIALTTRANWLPTKAQQRLLTLVREKAQALRN